MDSQWHSGYLDDGQVKNLSRFSNFRVVSILSNDVSSQGIVGNLLSFPCFQQLDYLQCKSPFQFRLNLSRKETEVTLFCFIRCICKATFVANLTELYHPDGLG